MQYEVDIRDIPYLRHGAKPLAARIYQPRGDGPFPAVLEAHGGAWCAGDRLNNETINLPVAQAGIVVVAIDYRLPPEATYPGSVADVNYAIRWLKLHAKELKSSPSQVGSMGTSAGGHLTLLNSLKPRDPRYAAIPLEGGQGIDASVPYVVSMWPVLCPLDSYHDRDYHPAAPGQAVVGGKAFWEKYWLTEEAMAEGSPVLALERGDRVELPHVFYLKNANEPADARHTTPQALVDRYLAAYRKAGGRVRDEYFEGADYDHIRTHPEAASSADAIRRIVEFIQQEARP